MIMLVSVMVYHDRFSILDALPMLLFEVQPKGICFSFSSVVQLGTCLGSVGSKQTNFLIRDCTMT